MTTYRDSHIGAPTIVLCLDTSASLASTVTVSSSLRGVMMFDLTVAAHKENIHSGYSGISPDPYMVGMEVLGRVVEWDTQKVD